MHGKRTGGFVLTRASIRPSRKVALFVATIATLCAATATTATTAAAATTATTAAAATAAGPPDPPGPVEDLVLSPASGNGARGLSFEATWTPPAETGDGIRTHYVVEAYDAIGTRLESTTTGRTSSGPIRGDRCRAPLGAAVRAVTQDPRGGGPIDGPTVRAQFGHLNLCEVNNSIHAEQTGPGALQVAVKREPPVDPYVAGPCTLTVDGLVAWSGLCGTREQTITVDGLAPGGHHLVLTTGSPRGDSSSAHAFATVG